MDKIKQHGFTLIELVMVIVILGILAAVALPKFADLSGDAKKATLQGALGAVNSASAIVHAKSLVDGTSSSASSTVIVEGGSVATVYGYPASTAIATAAGLASSDYSISESGGTTTIKPNNSTTCSFTYKQATASSATPPVITPPVVSAISGTC